MYITEIDLGGYGECAECILGNYRFEKPLKNQPKFMKIISIRIPIQMDIGMSCSENHWKYSQLWQHFSSRNSSNFVMSFFFTLFWVRGVRYNTSHRCGSHQSAPSHSVRFFQICSVFLNQMSPGGIQPQNRSHMLSQKLYKLYMSILEFYMFKSAAGEKFWR